MSSTSRAPHTAPETAARIRDTAIGAFAAQGFTRATVRGIASAAGVSPGLVIHHFGSKEGLRAACDDHVFETLTDAKQESANASPLLVGEMFKDDSTRKIAEYMLKSLLDHSEQGQRFFDHYVETVERLVENGFAGFTLRRAEDSRAQAVVIAMLGLAPLMLERRTRHALGTNDLSASFARFSPYLFDLYLHGVIESVPEGLDIPGPHSAPGSQQHPPASPAPDPDNSTSAEGTR